VPPAIYRDDELKNGLLYLYLRRRKLEDEKARDVVVCGCFGRNGVFVNAEPIIYTFEGNVSSLVKDDLNLFSSGPLSIGSDVMFKVVIDFSQFKNIMS
jgi:hypothetical protein